MSADLAENYKAGGFTGSVGRGRRAALLMVDFARAYFEPGSPLYAGSDAPRAAAERLLGAARAAGMRVVHTRVEYDAQGLNGGIFFRKVPALRSFVAGSPLAEFATGLAPADGEVVVTKQYASAFFGTSLVATLNAFGIDTLLICGMSTSGCVRASAVDAMQYGFVPLVVREACGDRHDGPHQANLFDLQAKYADVIGIDEALQLASSLA
ncbi:MAG: isochorismatase family protein [Burkholderiales bacterium]|nr:MAG: isochorismatase family protein [Burkholderiales bacterium]